MRWKSALWSLALLWLLSSCGEDPGSDLYGRWEPVAKGTNSVLFFEPDVMGYEMSAIPLPGGAKSAVYRLQVRISVGTIEMRPQKAQVKFIYPSGVSDERTVDPTSLVPFESGEVIRFIIRDDRLILIGKKGDPIVYRRG